jgi:putative alpha-1,2-mannosidase
VTIKLNNKYFKGKTFSIETENNSASNPYIQSIQINGKETGICSIPFDQVVKGGKMQIKLGSQPNTNLK